jgi:hypothetical protein
LNCVPQKAAKVANNERGERQSDARPLELTGTTLRVYRYLYRAGKPRGIHDIQRALALSSSSVAVYHVRKLLEAGMIREADQNASSTNDKIEQAKAQTLEGEKRAAGYVVDRLMFDNMIRIRRSLIPVQVGYAVFFASALVLLFSLFRPDGLSGAYIFAIIVIGVAVGVFVYQAFRTSQNRVL